MRSASASAPHAVMQSCSDSPPDPVPAITPPSLENVMPEYQSQLSTPDDLVADTPAKFEPFPFLRLPRDLRLIVYDNLITRSYQEVYVHCTRRPDDPLYTIILVTPDAIPPIHLACRFLGAEAGSFLKAKVMRFSTPWAAPRIILYTTSLWKALSWGGFVDSLLYIIYLVTTDPITVDEAEEALSPGSQISEELLQAAKAYAERATKYIRHCGLLSENWRDEAWRIYEPEELPRGHVPSDIEYEAEVLKKTLGLKTSARHGLLHIAVLSDYGPDAVLDLAKPLDDVADDCVFSHLKTTLQTVGWKIKETSKLRDSGWLRFDGEMDTKSWNEEWI